MEVYKSARCWFVVVHFPCSKFQETKEWFDRMKNCERTSPSRLALTSLEERQRFFDETRERILQSRLEDPFGQFVREHQERFAALTASFMGDHASAVEVGKQQQAAAQSAFSSATATPRETPTPQPNGEQQTSAADLVASILNGEILSIARYQDAKWPRSGF